MENLEHRTESIVEEYGYDASLEAYQNSPMVNQLRQALQTPAFQPIVQLPISEDEMVVVQVLGCISVNQEADIYA